MSDAPITGKPLPFAPLAPAGLQISRPLKPHQLIKRITSQHDLFIVAHLGIARVDAGSWRLRLDGLVDRPRELSFGDIRALPKRQIQSFHQCAGHPTKRDVAVRRIANVVWGGADLSELIQTVGVLPEARFIVAYGLDCGEYGGIDGGHYQKDVSLARLARGGVLLAYEVNGEPLTAEHGFPVRMVIPGYYGTNDVKWLGRLEFSNRRATGIYTTLFYNDPVPLPPDGAERSTMPLWEAPPESIIVSPRAGARLDRTNIEVWGWAWSANGVKEVDVSTDGGITWSPAKIESRTQWSWQRFVFHCTPATRAVFRIMARARDSAGAIQPVSSARNSIHAVTVEIIDT